MEQEMGGDADGFSEPAVDEGPDDFEEPWKDGADDAEAPPLPDLDGGPDGELGAPPPLPPGIGGDADGQSVIGGPPPPVVDLGGSSPPPPPPVPGVDLGDDQSVMGFGQPGSGAQPATTPTPAGGVDGADTTTPPPGEPTGEQGGPPPIPEGLESTGGSTSVIPSGQPGSGDEVATTTPTPAGGMEGSDTTTPPPGEPTGEQGEPPPVPEGLESTGDGNQSVIPAGQPGAAGETEPASLSNEAATQLLSGLLPGMHPEAVEVAIMGAADDGTIDVQEIITLLHAHGYETADEPATSIADVAASGECVLVGSVDGTLVPLTVDSVEADAGLLVCLDPEGSAFEARIEDVDRAWRSSGAPLLRSTGEAGASTSAAGVGDAGTAPHLESVPARAVTDADGSRLAGALAAGGAAFVPVALGGGILARRLGRRR